jgi:hypothetical protein
MPDEDPLLQTTELVAARSFAETIPGTFVRVIPEAKGPAVKPIGGGAVIVRTTGMKHLKTQVGRFNSAITEMTADAVRKLAPQLQQQIQEILLAAYQRSATGRFARSIRVNVVTSGDADKSKVALQIKAIPYRETRFLTNLGGIGRFKEFPVSPYRIYAKGAQNIVDQVTAGRGGEEAWFPNSRNAASRLKRLGAKHRLKVPRRTSFFTAARRLGRGGGESRTISDPLGPDEGEARGAFFFYPLWVNHPGFAADYLSDVAIAAGSTFQDEILTAVGQSGAKTSTITRGKVASGRIENPVSLDVQQYIMNLPKPIYMRGRR